MYLPVFDQSVNDFVAFEYSMIILTYFVSKVCKLEHNFRKERRTDNEKHEEKSFEKI